MEVEQHLRTQAAAANSIHEAKVRGLMAAISRLEHENFKLKHSNMEFKRVERFKKCQDELGRQDAMITSLSTLIIDEDRLRDMFSEVARMSIAELGPPKPREELVKELEHVSRQVAAAKQGVALVQRQQQIEAQRAVAHDTASQSEACCELKALAEDLERQAEQLLLVKESLQRQKVGLEQALDRQDALAMETQRDAIFHKPAAPQGKEIAAELEARLALRSAEAKRSREAVQQLRQRFQSLEDTIGRIKQESEAAEQACRQVQTQSREEERQRQLSYRERLRDQEEAVQHQAQQLERRREATRNEKEEWRAQSRQWDADLSAAKRQLIGKEEEAMASLEARKSSQLQAAKAEQHAKVHLELQSVEVAEAKMRVCTEASDRLLEQLTELRSVAQTSEEQAVALAEGLHIGGASRLKQEELWQAGAPPDQVQHLGQELEKAQREIRLAEQGVEETMARAGVLEERRNEKISGAEAMAKALAQLDEAEAALDSAVLAKAEDLKQILQDIAALEKEANEPLPVAPALPTPQAAGQPHSARLPWPVDILLAGVRAAVRKQATAAAEQQEETLAAPPESTVPALAEMRLPQEVHLHAELAHYEAPQEPAEEKAEQPQDPSHQEALGAQHFDDAAHVAEEIPPTAEVHAPGDSQGCADGSRPNVVHQDVLPELHRQAAQREAPLKPTAVPAESDRQFATPRSIAAEPMTALACGALPVAITPRHNDLRARLADTQQAISQEHLRVQETVDTRQRLEHYSLELEEEIRQLQLQLTAARVLMRRREKGGTTPRLPCRQCGYVGR